MRNASVCWRLSFLAVALVAIGLRAGFSQNMDVQASPSASLAASSFPKFRGDACNTGRASGRPLQAVAEWSFVAGALPISSPSYGGDGLLFFGSDVLHAIDAETGVQKWEFRPKVSGGFNGTPVLGINGMVYIGGGEAVYAVSRKNGREVWKYPVPCAINAACAVGKDGTVYAYYGSGALVALDGRTGMKKWETPVSNPYLNIGYITSSPALSAQGAVIFGGMDHKVYALDCRTGKTRWTHDIKQAIIMSSPAIGEDGTVYIGSSGEKNGKLVALDGNTGHLRWEVIFSGSVCSSPALSDNGLLYCGCEDYNVYALDQKTGEMRWKFTTANKVKSSAAIGMDGTVYIGSGDHKMYALDGKTGAKKWEYDAEEAIFSSPLLTPDGALFFSSHDGVYHALPKSKQEQLAKEQSVEDAEQEKPSQ